MRDTSPPIALSIAAAAGALAVAVLALMAVPSAAAAERWLRPVPGEVARPFSYARGAPFAAGAHRGVDLAAPPGTDVRAVCTGRVVYAGVVAGGEQVVSISCGTRRVSYLPLAAVATRVGERIRAGKPVGTVAPGHGGLHVGVRREGDRFGYLDPMALLAPPGRPYSPAPRAPVPRLTPRAIVPRPATRPTAISRVTVPEVPALAPWPVWVGLGLLLCGAAGSRTATVRRCRRRPVHARATRTA